MSLVIEDSVPIVRDNVELIQHTHDDQMEYFISILLTDQNSAYAFHSVLLDTIASNIRFNRLSKLTIKGFGMEKRIGDFEVVRLVEALVAANIQLEEISLPYHRITDNGFDELLRLLNPMDAAAPINDQQNQPHRALVSLNLEGNDIEGEVIVGSILTTPYDCPLLNLNLACNPLSAAGQEAVAEIVYSNKVMIDLNINSCGFELRGLNTLTATMRENHTLECLALDRPILTKFREGEVMEQLAKILETNRSLRTLSLRYHNATDHDMKLITNALYSNSSLMYINLESNKIGVTGAEALASNMLFKGQHSLQFLALSYNFVSDHGAIALAQAIKANTGLKVLTLKNNSIGPLGLAALATALETSTNLEFITLFGNRFDNATGMQYHRLVKQRFPYTQVFIDIDVYVVDGQYMIAEVSK
jgi:Ran GTPase-activating protein (RanGAP) involved in mRNA processing and transport